MLYWTARNRRLRNDSTRRNECEGTVFFIIFLLSYILSNLLQRVYYGRIFSTIKCAVSPVFLTYLKKEISSLSLYGVISDLGSHFLFRPLNAFWPTYSDEDKQ